MAEIPNGILLQIRTKLPGRIVGTIYLKKKLVSLKELLETTKPVKIFGSVTYRFSFSEISKDNNIRLFQIDLKKTHSRGKTEGQFFVTEDTEQNVIYCFSNTGVDFLKSGIQAFMEDNFFTRITRCYVTSENIREALGYFEKYLKGEFYATKASAKRMFGRNPISMIEFETQPQKFEQIFAETKKKELWIQWIEIENKTNNNDSTKMQFSLSREGRFELRRGSLPYFTHILEKLAKTGLGYTNLFDKRELKPHQDAKPLILDYGEDVFEETSVRKKLISSFDKYQNCSYSVMHGGNPHVYLYVQDKSDFSSFSVRSIGTTKLMITPLFKGNISAIYRLVNHLVENFREHNKIEEFK